MKRILLFVLTTFALLPVADAQAKRARCFTTDDGEYACRFRATDDKGSFEISAPGKPWFALIINEQGVASGFANYGTGRNISLPGEFYRSGEDPACWRNSATNVRICAW